MLPDRDSALEGLSQLTALGDEVALEWPDGQTLHVSTPLDESALQVTIASDAGSFLASLSLAIPDHDGLKLAQLVDYLSASPGRFLPLENEGRYLDSSRPAAPSTGSTGRSGPPFRAIVKKPNLRG